MIKTARPLRPQFDRTGSLLIGAGLLVLALAFIRGALAYQQYNSPFDEVDSSSDYEVGFLPLISSEDSVMGGADWAPLITVSENGRHPVAMNDSLQARSGSTGDSSASAGLPGAKNPVNDTLSAGAGSVGPGGASPQGKIPDRIVIPAIGVDGPIEPVGLREIEYKREKFLQWTAPNAYAAGWHNTSAPLGMAGNTVINGHHNAFGEIFRDLVDLEAGDLIYVYSGDNVYPYRVGLSTRFNERFRPIEERLENARWILPSPDERLTIITCWPYESNTHRVVIVAVPDLSFTGTVE